LKFYVNETYGAETEARLRRSKNASRPSRDRDVRDRDYSPVRWHRWSRM